MGKQEMSRQSTADFQGSEIIPYDTVMVNTCCKFVRTQDTTPRVNPNVKYCTLGNNDVSIQVHCKKCTQCGMLIVWEAVSMQGQEIHGKSLYLLLSCAVNLKLLLKQSIRKQGGMQTLDIKSQSNSFF